MDGLGGAGERLASRFQGLQVQIGVFVALDGEIIFDGFLQAVKVADCNQGDQDWLDVDLAAAKQVDCVADVLHV